MPPQPPLARLPIEWEAWETMLADATEQHLQLGDKAGLSDAEKAKSERWRQRVRDVSYSNAYESSTNHAVLANRCPCCLQRT